MDNFKELDDKYRATMHNYMKAIDQGNKRLVDVLSKKLDRLYDQMRGVLQPIDDAELHKQEWLEERAAILEFDCGYDRTEADKKALELWNDKQRRES